MMGTRGVLHLKSYRIGRGKDVWVAVHWDAYALAQETTDAIERVLASDRVQRDGEVHRHAAMREVPQAALHTAVDHTIDAMSTRGLDPFTDAYDDFAEYIVEVTFDRVNGRVLVAERPLAGTFTTNLARGDGGGPITDDGLAGLETAVEGDYALGPAPTDTGNFPAADHTLNDDDQVAIAVIDAPWLPSLPDHDAPTMVTA